MRSVLLVSALLLIGACGSSVDDAAQATTTMGAGAEDAGSSTTSATTDSTSTSTTAATTTTTAAEQAPEAPEPAPGELVLVLDGDVSIGQLTSCRIGSGGVVNVAADLPSQRSVGVDGRGEDPSQWTGGLFDESSGLREPIAFFAVEQRDAAPTSFTADGTTLPFDDAGGDAWSVVANCEGLAG